MPQKDEVREAVEIAELFINATQNILWHKFISDYFVLQEKIKILPENKEYIMFLKASISNNFEYLPKIFGCDIDTKYINYEIKEV